MKKLLIILFLTSCAPISTSIPKDYCPLSTSAQAVRVGDHSADVNLKMNYAHDVSMNSNSDLVWTYNSTCASVVIVMRADEVVQVLK